MRTILPKKRGIPLPFLMLLAHPLIASWGRNRRKLFIRHLLCARYFIAIICFNSYNNIVMQVVFIPILSHIELANGRAQVQMQVCPSSEASVLSSRSCFYFKNKIILLCTSASERFCKFCFLTIALQTTKTEQTDSINLKLCLKIRLLHK